MTTFTVKETQLLCACMEFLKGDFISSIDFHKVAVKAGYKDAKNARIMFMRLKKGKLSGGDDTTAPISGDTATPDGSPTKPTKKRKVAGDVTKPAAKRGRKANAAKAPATEEDGNVDDEEEGVRKETKKDEADESDETVQEAGEEA